MKANEFEFLAIFGFIFPGSLLPDNYNCSASPTKGASRTHIPVSYSLLLGFFDSSAGFVG